MKIFRKRMPNGKLSPTFYFRVNVNNKLIERSTGCKTEREANSFATKYVDSLRKQKTAEGIVANFRDVLSGGNKIPLNADVFDLFLSKYLLRKSAAGRKPREIGPEREKNKRTQWNDFVGFMAATFPAVRNLSDVTPAMAEEYIAHLRASGKYDKQVAFRHNGHRRNIQYTIAAEQLSPATTNSYHTTLQQIFRVLTPDASIVTNPFQDIPKLSHDYESREPFTPAELKRIGEKADEFLYPIFAIGVNTGLREGDICLLKKSGVDLAGGWITHKMSKTNRTVKIPILNSIRGYLTELMAKSDGEYLLPEHARMYQENRTGIGYRVSRFLESEVGIATTREVEGRSRRVSVKDVHSCRHTFAYLAAVNGVPYPVVKDIVGHIDKRVTELYTDHVTDEVKKIKMQYLPDYLGLPAASNFAEPEPSGNSSRDERLRHILQSMTPKNFESKRREALALLLLNASDVI